MRSFFLFLLAFPLDEFATCFAFWIAACLMCEPFMISEVVGVMTGTRVVGALSASFG